MLVDTDDRVSLPVPWLLAQLNLYRALKDVALAPQHSPGIHAVVTLTALFRHDSHVAIEIATSFLVFEDVPVDRFVADAANALILERVADLLGAPFPHQQRLNLMPLIGAKP